MIPSFFVRAELVNSMFSRWLFKSTLITTPFQPAICGLSAAQGMTKALFLRTFPDIMLNCGFNFPQ